MGGASPFEAMAATYDRDFTGRPIAKKLRRAVWRRLDAAFPPGSRVLELGCGTGEDAAHLAARGVFVLATDPAEAMCAAAREKAAREGVHGRVEVRRLAAEGVSQLAEEFDSSFDGAFANFGVLNCVADLPALAAALAPIVKRGGTLLFCVMGRHAPLEWLFFLRRGDPKRAFRRMGAGDNRGGGKSGESSVAWRGLEIHYRPIRAIARDMLPHFTLERAAALGALLPPPEATEWAEEHPDLLDLLERCERRLETLAPLPSLADHALLELRRT